MCVCVLRERYEGKGERKREDGRGREGGMKREREGGGERDGEGGGKGRRGERDGGKAGGSAMLKGIIKGNRQLISLNMY